MTTETDPAQWIDTSAAPVAPRRVSVRSFTGAPEIIEAPPVPLPEGESAPSQWVEPNPPPRKANSVKVHEQALSGWSDANGIASVSQDAAAPTIEAHLGTGTDLNNFVQLPAEPAGASGPTDQSAPMPASTALNDFVEVPVAGAPGLTEHSAPRPAAAAALQAQPVAPIPADVPAVDNQNPEAVPGFDMITADGPTGAADAFIDPDPKALSAPPKLKPRPKKVDGGPIEDWVDPQYHQIASDRLQVPRAPTKDQEERRRKKEEEELMESVPPPHQSVFEDIDYWQEDEEEEGVGGWFFGLFGKKAKDPKKAAIPAVYHKNVYQRAVEDRYEAHRQEEYQEELRQAEDAILRGYDVKLPRRPPPPPAGEEEQGGAFSDLEELDQEGELKSQAAFSDIDFFKDEEGGDAFEDIEYFRDDEDEPSVVEKIQSFFGLGPPGETTSRAPPRKPARDADVDVDVVPILHLQAAVNGTVIALIKFPRNLDWSLAKERVSQLKQAASHFYYAPQPDAAPSIKVHDDASYQQFLAHLDRLGTNTAVINVQTDVPQEPEFTPPVPAPLKTRDYSWEPEPTAARDYVPGAAFAQPPPHTAPAPAAAQATGQQQAAAQSSGNSRQPMDLPGSRPQALSREEYAELYTQLSQLAEKGLISEQQEAIAGDLIANEDAGVIRAFRTFEAKRDDTEFAKDVSFLTGVQGPMSSTSLPNHMSAAPAAAAATGAG